MRFEHTLEVTELVMPITEKRMFQAERIENMDGFLIKEQEES